MYEVNDIIYSTLPESGKIVPLKVVEVQILKRENSEEIKYKVRVPSKSDKTYCLSKFNMTFDSIEEIKSYLLDNATRAINKMVEESNDLETKYFNKKEKIVLDEVKVNEVKVDEVTLQGSQLEHSDEDDYIKVDLGNGQIGKIKPDFVS